MNFFKDFRKRLAWFGTGLINNPVPHRLRAQLDRLV